MASTCTSALPGGQPVPRSEIPRTLTFEGASLRSATSGEAAARPRRRVRIVAMYILDKSADEGWNQGFKRSNEEWSKAFDPGFKSLEIVEK